MKKKITVLMIVILLISSVAVFFIFDQERTLKKYYATQETFKSSETEIDSSIDISEDINLSDKYTDTSEYNQEYIEYMNLSEEEKKKFSVIPDKYKVKMELLDNEYIKALYSENETQIHRFDRFRTIRNIIRSIE